MSESNRLGPGWNRSQVSFWLSPERRQDLMAIAMKLPDEATPSDAIARSIQLARMHLASGEIDPAELLDTIDTAVTGGFANAKAAIDEQASAILDVGRDLRRIHGLLAALANEEGIDPVDSSFGARKPMAVCDWLEAQLALAGQRPQRSAVATGCWHSIERAGERLVSVDLSLSLMAIDGKPIPTARHPEPSIARFESLEASHPFATADWPAKLFLVCQPVGGQWVFHLHRAGTEGSAGQAIGKVQV